MNDGRPQSPLFVKSYDFLLWLIPITLKFPKSQRFLLAEKLDTMALTFYDLVLEAAMENNQQAELLRQADKQLTKMRLYIRLSFDLRCLSLGQYEYASRSLAEIGRLLGGWQKKIS
jgi:hypothetical protein